MSQNKNIEIFCATAHGKGWPTTVSIDDTPWSFQVDEPTEDGGNNSGPNPMHHFVASLAGCQNEQAQVVAEELGFSADNIELTVEVALDLSGFMGISDNSDRSFRQVKLTVRVAGVTEKQARELGERVDARCPILGLLRSSGATIESRWTPA